MTFAARLKSLRKAAGLTQEQLAHACGWSGQSRIANYESSSPKARQPKPDEAMRMAAALGVSVADLLGESPGGPESAGWADVIGYAQAAALGDGSLPEDYAETHALKFKTSSLRRKGLRADRLAVYYGDGDSMEPTIKNGDAILFDTSDTRLQDGKLFMVRYDGHVTAKRLLKLGRAWFLSSDNTTDPKWRKPVPIDETKDFEVIGRVRWIAGWED